MATPFRLRPAGLNDKPVIYAIKADAMKPYVIATWGAWDEDFQSELFAQSFNLDRFQIIEVDGEFAGFLELEPAEPGIRLRNIALGAEWRNQGIGSAVISQLLESQSAIRLRVLKVNRARDLYERLGFVCIGDPDGHWWEMRWESPRRCL